MQNAGRLGLALLAAVAVSAVPARGVSPDVVAQATIRNLLQGDLDAALAAFDARGMPADPAATARALREVLADVGLDPSIDEVYRHVQLSASTGRREDFLAYHVVGREAAALVLVTLVTTDGTPRVRAFYCVTAPLDLRDRHPFVWSGLSWVHYLFLGGVAAIALITVTAVVLCFRRPVRRRWLRVPLMLVGLGGFQLYWVPGPFREDMLRVQPVSVHMPAVAYVKSPIFDPWRVTASVPIFALVFLVRHGRRRGDARPAEAPGASPPPAEPGPSPPPVSPA